MSIFVTDNERDAISLPEDPENIIYLRTRFSVAMQAHIQAAGVRIEGGKQSGDLERANDALLQSGVLGWEGPKFQLSNGELAPLTMKYIRALDAKDPLTAKALAELNKRAMPTASPDPKLAASNGSTPNGDGDSTTLTLRDEASTL